MMFLFIHERGKGSISSGRRAVVRSSQAHFTKSYSVSNRNKRRTMSGVEVGSRLGGSVSSGRYSTPDQWGGKLFTGED